LMFSHFPTFLSFNSTLAVSYMIRQGYFPGAVKGPTINSRWRIPEENVQKFIETRITRVETERKG